MIQSQLTSISKKGDRETFARLVSEFQNMVFNTALSIVQDDEEARDVAQETFIQVYQSMDQFKGESKLSTWIYRITVTKALDWQRKKTRKKRFASIRSLFGTNNELQFESPDFYHPGIILENKERSALLFRALNKLPESQRVAFILTKVEGQSQQDVAEIMNVSVGAIESYLHRAKQNLRKQLENFYKN